MKKISFKSLLICCLCFAGISCSGRSAQQQEATEIEEYSGLDNADLSLTPVKQDGRCGYINLKGEYAIKPQFADADYFREGLAWVKSADGKVGYIGKDGNYVIAAEYAHGTPFSEGLAFVMSADESASVCIDTKGNVKFTLQQATIVNPFYKGFAFFADKDNSSDFIILAIRNRTRNLVALSLSKFVFNPESENFLIIEGRKTGFWQWVLVQLKLGNRYQILVNKDQISYSEDSARGNSLLLTPLSKIASTGGGYSKPVGLLITAALLAVFGLGQLFHTYTATMGIISILVAALLVVLYHFRKSFFINVQPVSGAVFGFTFKRSIIENVEVDTELIKRGIAFLNEKVIAASK